MKWVFVSVPSVLAAVFSTAVFAGPKVTTPQDAFACRLPRAAPATYLGASLGMHGKAVYPVIWLQRRFENECSKTTKFQNARGNPAKSSQSNCRRDYEKGRLRGAFFGFADKVEAMNVYTTLLAVEQPGETDAIIEEKRPGLPAQGYLAQVYYPLSMQIRLESKSDDQAVVQIESEDETSVGVRLFFSSTIAGNPGSKMGAVSEYDSAYPDRGVSTLAMPLLEIGEEINEAIRIQWSKLKLAPGELPIECQILQRTQVEVARARRSRFGSIQLTALPWSFIQNWW